MPPSATTPRVRFLRDRLSAILLDMGRVDEAIVVLRASGPANHRSAPSINFTLARALLAKGEFAEALALLRKPETRGPARFGDGSPADGLARRRTIACARGSTDRCPKGLDRPKSATENAELAPSALSKAFTPPRRVSGNRPSLRVCRPAPSIGARPIILTPLAQRRVPAAGWGRIHKLELSPSAGPVGGRPWNGSSFDLASLRGATQDR